MLTCEYKCLLLFYYLVFLRIIIWGMPFFIWSLKVVLKIKIYYFIIWVNDLNSWHALKFKFEHLLFLTYVYVTQPKMCVKLHFIILYFTVCNGNMICWYRKDHPGWLLNITYKTCIFFYENCLGKIHDRGFL